MRTIRVIMLVVASVVSASVVQAQQGQPGAAIGRPAGERERGLAHGHDGLGGLMRGIKLSESERAKLKEIREKYKAEARPLRESMKPAMHEARAARQKGDTAAARAAWERTRTDRDRARLLMERALGETRAALSAEHQAQFDANVAQRKQLGEDGRWQGGHGKGGKGRGGHRRT